VSPATIFVASETFATHPTAAMPADRTRRVKVVSFLPRVRAVDEAHAKWKCPGGLAMTRSKIRRYIRHGMLPQLAVFEAVARLGSYTRAAEELYMAQPTVSIHMKKLTEAVGFTLIEQTGRKLLLTEAGRELSAACRDIFDRLVETEDRIAALRALDQGRLRIAASSAGKYFIPRLLGRFCARHPKVQVALHIDNWQGMRTRMQDNTDDLYVLSTLPKDVELTHYPVLPNPIEIFARSDHPLAQRGTTSVARLAEEHFILREPGSATRRLTEEWFAAQGLQPRVRMELGSDETIKQAVLGGLGVAMMSRCVVGLDQHNPDLCALKVPGFPVMKQWLIAHPSGRQLSQVASAFLDYVRANDGTDILAHLEDAHIAQHGALAIADRMVK